jgi:hypothetical protein
MKTDKHHSSENDFVRPRGNARAVELTHEDVLRLPLIVTSKNLYVIDSKTKRTRKLFVQRSDIFATDLFTLLNDLKSAEITEVSFRNELLGDFRLTRTKGGYLKGYFEPVNKPALAELKSRLERQI